MDLNPLRSEVAVLRQKLHDMGATNKRSELLLGQVKVLEEESQRKDEKLRMLNDKLHGIQRGLVHIDEERTSLQEKIKKLKYITLTLGFPTLSIISMVLPYAKTM